MNKKPISNDCLAAITLASPALCSSVDAPTHEVVASYCAALEAGQLANILSNVVVVTQCGKGMRWLSQAAAISALAIAAEFAPSHALVACCASAKVANGTQHTCEMTMENVWRTALGLDAYRSRLTLYIDADGKCSNVNDSQNAQQFRADCAQIDAFLAWLQDCHPIVCAGVGRVVSADFIRTTRHGNLLPYAQQWSAAQQVLLSRRT